MQQQKKKKKKSCAASENSKEKSDSGEARKMREMRKYDTMFVWNTLDKLLRLTEPQFPVLLNGNSKYYFAGLLKN